MFGLRADFRGGDSGSSGVVENMFDVGEKK